MFYYMDSPIGVLQIESKGDVLYSMRIINNFTSEFVTPNDNIIVKQLNEYFAGSRTVFNINKKLIGTPFQLRVWQALEEIPYGETVTYKQIAEKIGQPKAVRAVGGAIHRNPIPIIIPCHRVVGSNGKMVGFAFGIGIKEWLLKLENSINNQN